MNTGAPAAEPRYGYSEAVGSTKQNVEPVPAPSDSTQILPPWLSTSRRRC